MASNLRIQKRTDKAGRTYYIDRDSGKRSSGLAYSVQFGSNGFTSREDQDSALKIIKAEGIKKPEDAREIVNKFQDLTRVRREKEQVFQDKEVEIQYWDLKELVSSAPEEQFKIKSPTGEIYYNYNRLQALEVVENIISALNTTIAEFNKKQLSPYINPGQMFIDTTVNVKDDFLKMDFTQLQVQGLDPAQRKLFNDVFRDQYGLNKG